MKIQRSRRQSAEAVSRSGATLALLALAMLIIAIDFNIVYVALPSIGREVGFSAQTLQWVVSAYAVTAGGFLLLGGRAVDRLGPRRMFVSALNVYALASLLGGFASDAGVVVAARALQGVGAAVLFPATLALININFAEGPPRTRAMAVWGAASSSGLIVGSAGGGLLTHFLGWPSVFLVNVPLAVGAAVVAIRIVAPDPPRTLTARGFDLPGALLATSGATLVVFGLIAGPDAGWRSLEGGGAVATGLALFVAFLLVERRPSLVLLPRQLLRQRSLMVAVGLVIAFMTGINYLHYAYFLQLQDVLGLDAFRAGLAFVPITVGGVIGSAKILPMLLDRYGLTVALLAGLLGLGASMAALAPTITPHGSVAAMVPSTLLWGASAGVAFSAIFLAAGSGTTATEHGVASALVSTAQQVGGAVGLAVLVAVANAGRRSAESGPPLADDAVAGLRLGLWVGAVVVTAAAFLSSALPGRRRATGVPEVGAS